MEKLLTSTLQMIESDNQESVPEASDSQKSTDSVPPTQMVSCRQAIDLIRQQGITVDDQGRLVVPGGVSLTGPLNLITNAREGQVTDPEKITTHPLYLDRKAGKTEYKPPKGCIIL